MPCIPIDSLKDSFLQALSRSGQAVTAFCQIPCHGLKGAVSAAEASRSRKRLAFAALLGDKVYSFGELLLHPIVSVQTLAIQVRIGCTAPPSCWICTICIRLLCSKTSDFAESQVEMGLCNLEVYKIKVARLNEASDGDQHACNAL